MSEPNLDCVSCGLGLIRGRCYKCNPINTVKSDPGYVSALEAELQKLERAIAENRRLLAKLEAMERVRIALMEAIRIEDPIERRRAALAAAQEKGE